MTDILNRITRLAEMLSIDITPCSTELAELKGYAAGLEMIFDDMAVLEKQVFPLTASGSALSFICNQFNIDGNLADEDKYRFIDSGFKYVFGDYVNGAMADAFKKYNVECSGSDGKIILCASSYKDSKVIENMGRIFRNYLSPASEVVPDGDGIDFDFWDSTPYLFDDYDRLDIPFYILDKLK